MVRSILIGGLAFGLVALPALASNRTGEPIGEITFTTDPGAMGPRYLRALQLQVGDRPTEAELDLAAERLMELSNLDKVQLQRSGSLLQLDLADHPVTSFSVMPFPYFWQFGAYGAVERWHVFGRYLDAHAGASYNWDTLWVYDPRSNASAPGTYPNPYGEFEGDLGLLVVPDLQLFVVAEGYVSGITGDMSTTYDPRALARGFSSSLGPEVRYANVDSDYFPREGIRSRLRVFFGSPGDYALYQGEFERYTPIGDRETVVTAVRAGLSRGEVPWNQKLRAGGGDNLRGSLYDRFLGDQVLAGALEYRRRLTDDLMPSLYKGVGLYSGLFVDVGRAWDSRFGAPFPEDMRPGVGGYLGVSIARSNLVRLEVSEGIEGPYAGLMLGLPFDW